MLTNLKIGTRLSIILIIILISYIAVIFFIINRMDYLSTLTTKMYRHPLTVSNAVLKIDSDIIRMHRTMKDIVMADKESEIEKYSKIINTHEDNIYDNFKIIKKRFLGRKGMYEKAEKAFTEWKPIRDNVISLMKQGYRHQAANITRGKGARHVELLTTSVRNLEEFARYKAKIFLNDTIETRDRTFTLVYIVTGITISAMIILLAFLIKSITGPLGILMETAQKIGNGNLDVTTDLSSYDEFGQLSQAFNEMSRKLKESYRGLEEKVSVRTEELRESNKRLEHEITEKQNAEKTIKASLVEKETMLMEIHHRVKNNFQIIVSLLNLQQKRIKDETVLIQFLEAKNRIMSMAIVHEKLYNSKDFTNIDFSVYLHTIAQQLFITYNINSNEIDFSIDAGHVLIDINNAIPLGLIANELLSNILKYAFPEKRKKRDIITISMSQNAGTINLTISDNGIGLPDNIDFEKTGTLGMKIVNLLTDQIEGELHIDRNNGTAFSISFRT